MARFIVIERGTGRVYGDTARLSSAEKVVSPADAVCLFDRHLGRATRGFGYVKPDSDAASYDVYEIPRSRSDAATASDPEARALVREHGSLVTALVSYNS
ncbi:hypothetical protein [Methylobacterium planeticum]|uniref:Uncharacterized protein n=1 Tax=Methylobacterium planeticum TaxID=2615211 RepID=A0A6N6MLV6_9HYPH|nr:hypothetical protein [Methylobacterium planeticum]KAB1069962.1 hypothetical protein F6X51_24310 [Methylobacterium planeticum]